MRAHTALLTLSFAFLEFPNLIDAKFCAFELNGERRYYTCPRNEYCCNFGCCVSPAFQFYQLWYYWLLVIFMFLLCSGGGWWYRYWLQSRYRTCPGSALPISNPAPRHSRAPTRAPSTQPRRPSRPRVARVSYNPNRDAIVLHRIWKGPPRNCPPPSYSSAQAEFSSDVSNHSSPYHSRPPLSTTAAAPLFPPGRIHNSSDGIGGQECPYYQLYGPPPSYDSVMSEIGENSIPIASPVRQTANVNSSPEEASAVESENNETIESSVRDQSESNRIDSVHHVESSSDGLSISNNNVCASQSLNVQNQDTVSSKQTTRDDSKPSST